MKNKKILRLLYRMVSYHGAASRLLANDLLRDDHERQFHKGFADACDMIKQAILVPAYLPDYDKVHGIHTPPPSYLKKLDKNQNRDTVQYEN